MESLVGYGSDDEVESERHGKNNSSVDSGAGSGAPRRRDDDTNYDDVNMDMSEESGGEEGEALRAGAGERRHGSRGSNDSRERGERRGRRESPRRDRPDDRHRGERGRAAPHSHDHRDAVSPRFVGRDRGRERDREHRHARHSPERRSSHHERHSERRERSRSRPAAHPPHPPPPHTSERRHGDAEYRPSSYKVNKKLEVMEKMGLQIKTPDGSMATARQLRAAAGDTAGSGALPSYYNPSAHGAKILDQVQKRKLLWSNKNKSEAEEAAKWSGARFAQDSDGKQVSKFMRLMGIKEPAAVKPEPSDATVDPIKKQEELFQAMQAQYEVARATTHTMRGVGLGFQRGQF